MNKLSRNPSAIWALFIAFLVVCTTSLVYFQNKSRSLLGSDFTALAIDVVQSQYDVRTINSQLVHLEDGSVKYDAALLVEALFRQNYRIPLIVNKLKRSAIEESQYEAMVSTLDQIKAKIGTTINQVNANTNGSLSNEALLQILYPIELEIAWSYSEIHSAVQSVSSLEKRLRKGLTILVWGLFFTIMLVIAALVFVLTRSFEQRYLLSKQNELDDLTGLYNRRYLMKEAEYALQQSDSSIGLAIIDLDLFKAVNDNFGHPVGDEVLKRIARILSANMQDGIVARLGGEEFCLLFTALSSEQQIEKCEQIRTIIEHATIGAGNVKVKITISMGFCYRKPHEDVVFSQLYQQADKALYLAKKNGRNQVSWHGCDGELERNSAVDIV
ncbi:GGDEF domain-containing protein [Marinomonas balearica]|uniref:diguanylate cyclase n=1 Tax=Marinomonas balearica TaxID=491947 RepID=A0A4V6PTU9_9GAMM|nr:GGDEF domain-containing protein [Marinomonas balearica]TDO98132.1 diguanylate cyclase (GGDEF)-like protein [Marinomonas balearica]